MKVNIEIERAPEPLYQCHRSRVGFRLLVAGFVYQVSGQCAVHDTQNLAHDLGLVGEQVSEREGETENPLAHRPVG